MGLAESEGYIAGATARWAEVKDVSCHGASRACKIYLYTVHRTTEGMFSEGSVLFEQGSVSRLIASRDDGVSESLFRHGIIGVQSASALRTHSQLRFGSRGCGELRLLVGTGK